LWLLEKERHFAIQQKIFFDQIYQFIFQKNILLISSKKQDSYHSSLESIVINLALSKVA